MKESAIQSRIIKQLTAHGWLVIKLIQTNTNGIPDLLALKGGRAVFIEVKKQGNKPTDLQKYRIKQLQDKGFEAFCAWDPAEVEHLCRGEETTVCNTNFFDALDGL